MRLTIMGKRWWLRFCALALNRGECDPPDKLGKEIRVLKRLKGEERLEVLIHEQLHAADWHKSEEWIEQVSKDIARNLTKLGYTDGSSER
jgi:hypothetical protein